ncbi:MAG: DAHL domain-containing protein [Janthinobacterium lividum]
MSLVRMVAAASVLASGLTWLLVYSLQLPGTELAAVTQSLAGISFAETSLESDILAVRGGLLQNYDPINADVARLHACVAQLREVSNGAAAEIIAGIADSIDAEERLAETFKSANALAQNSFAYVTLLSDRLVRTEDAGDVAARTGALTASVLQMTRQPTPDAIAETKRRLADIGLGSTLPQLEPDVASLVLHGNLLVEMLPTLDGSARRFPALLTRDRREAVRAVFEHRQEARERRAERYRLAVYGVAILILGSLVELGRRLRIKALALQERANVEHQLTKISNTFIGCRFEDIRPKILETLSLLGCQSKSVRIYMFILSDEPDLLTWTKRDIASPAGWPGALADVIPSLAAECGHVFSTAKFGGRLPPAVVALLKRYDVPRWSCVKLFDQDEFIGVLAFERAPDAPAWHSDMTSPLNLTGIILSNALHRERVGRRRAALEAKVQLAKRLETVGLFASGIAHNFNNLLGVMLGHAEMIGDRTTLPASVRQDAHSITATGERARALVQSILDYGRRDKGVRRPIAMGPLTSETVALLAPSLPVRIDCDIRVRSDAGVTADPTQMQQVLVNLIRNAAQASVNGEPVQVSVEALNVGKRRRLSHGTVEPGHFLRICVTDRGIGIPADVQPQLFRPFFTTRPAGTGLGLATAAEVVRGLGGAFDLQSIVGQGTSFAFWLPLDRVAGSNLEEPSMGRGEVIMVVARQPSLRRQAEDTIAAFGYEPVGMPDAGASLAAFRADPTRFDLVLIGHDLADMTGPSLASLLRRIDERVPLVSIGAQSDNGLLDRREPMVFDEMLACPLVPAILASVMARLVRRPAPEWAEEPGARDGSLSIDPHPS